jgi:hypothetical protein
MPAVLVKRPTSAVNVTCLCSDVMRSLANCINMTYHRTCSAAGQSLVHKTVTGQNRRCPVRDMLRIRQKYADWTGLLCLGQKLYSYRKFPSDQVIVRFEVLTAVVVIEVIRSSDIHTDYTVLYPRRWQHSINCKFA